VTNHLVPNSERIPLTPLDRLELEGDGRESGRANTVEDGGDVVASVDAGDEQQAHLVHAAAPEWSTALEYEATGPQPVPLTVEQTTDAVRNGLLGGTEPSVAALFLLDAERALHQGRFREAVLFCWSTIDSVFNLKYDALVDAVLGGEWAAGWDVRVHAAITGVFPRLAPPRRWSCRIR
jgi:hypothetical protein